MGTARRTYDLTRYYNRIKLEKKDWEFFPDVLTLNAKWETQKVYIEVAITHYLSEQKSHSDNKIIEIQIASEEDIDKIRARLLTEDDAAF